MTKRAEYVFININKLYSPKTPTPERIVEYYNKMWTQLPDDITDKHLVFTGTAPMWLILRLITFLTGVCLRISIRPASSEWEYVVYYANNKLGIFRPRKIKD